MVHAALHCGVLLLSLIAGNRLVGLEITSLVFDSPGDTITGTDFVTTNDNEYFDVNTGGGEPAVVE